MESPLLRRPGFIWTELCVAAAVAFSKSPPFPPPAHLQRASERASFSSSSQFKFGASFFSSSSFSSSFALLQLFPPLRLLQLEVNIHSPHLLLNDAHEFFSSTASRVLISLCTPPSHSVCVGVCVCLSLSLFILSV